MLKAKMGKQIKTAEKLEISNAESMPLGQLRLLIALDALLVEGSVGGAAKQMGLSAAAMSRLLGQIREKFNDPILVRSGRSMVATPRAEALRGRLRYIASEAAALMEPERQETSTQLTDSNTGWNHESQVSPPPLGFRNVIELENSPTPEQVAAQFANIQNDNDCIHRLAKYIAVTGRKAGHTRPLRMDEAEDAFTTIFAGEADPMQISALLRLIHYRGETAHELAGMTLAAQKYFAAESEMSGPGLDWPAYLSPNSQQSPWFMLSALLVSRAGYPVVLHGNCGGGELSGKLELAAEAVGIPIGTSISQAKDLLKERRICFVPLAGFAPQIHALLSLYPLFESRSSINSLVHLLNPIRLSASVMGVTQPAYRELHRDVAALLNWRSVSVVSSSRDVAELASHRSHTIYRLIHGEKSDLILPTASRCSTQRHAGMSTFEYWQAIWSGAAVDKRAEITIISTTALALMTVLGADIDSYTQFYSKAEQLWHQRHS